MFLKSLQISISDTIIRDIQFRKGMNLIVDESEDSITGNNVGKTTVLKLIDYCFGANKRIIWEDPENKNEEYLRVKDFLIDNKVLITLTLTADLDDPKSPVILIERNFIPTVNGLIRRINGEDITSEEKFRSTLRGLLFPSLTTPKPTLRQIVSKSIRYDEVSLNNTLRTIHQTTQDVEYETLHLFWLGCPIDQSPRKLQINEQLKQEQNYQKRLQLHQSKSGYEAMLSLVESEIKELNKRKEALDINENFKEDLDLLAREKQEIASLGSAINKLEIRKEMILTAKAEMEKDISTIDINQVKALYNQTKNLVPTLQKTFEELYHFHNTMIKEKMKFIENQLPSIQETLDVKRLKLDELLLKEKKLAQSISQSATYEDLEELIAELTAKFQRKGELENTIAMMSEAEESISTLSKEMDEIDSTLFSDEFEKTVKKQLDLFNESYFAKISGELYGEKFLMKKDIVVTKTGRKVHKFSIFNADGPNVASGKKQGEIASFDIAYIEFATAQHIEALHFVLNDKKELMHDNQLVKIASLVNRNNNVQFVASILRDKLPPELNREDYFILKLSEKDKLFKIETLESE